MTNYYEPLLETMLLELGYFLCYSVCSWTKQLPTDPWLGGLRVRPNHRKHYHHHHCIIVIIIVILIIVIFLIIIIIIIIIILLLFSCFSYMNLKQASIIWPPPGVACLCKRCLELVTSAVRTYNFGSRMFLSTSQYLSVLSYKYLSSRFHLIIAHTSLSIEKLFRTKLVKRE